MKKKVTIDTLSKQLNISKTTISRAINHCPGVSPNTKNIIFQTALNHGYEIMSTTQNVGVVLPSSPDYFWGNLRKSISFYTKSAHIQNKHYIYATLYAPADALRCIEQAISDGVSVLILAVPDSADIRKRLEEVSSDIFILFIEEFLDVRNAFYIGENSFAHGYDLAERYITAHPEARHFAIFRSTDFPTEKMRVDGFLSALNDYSKEIIADTIITSPSKTKASNYARELAQLKTPPDCIFCPSGNLSHMVLALKKLKKCRNIHCIGFDINVQKDFSPDDKNFITDILLQDTDLQAKKALESTRIFLQSQTFPDTKNIYVDSVYHNIH